MSEYNQMQPQRPSFSQMMLSPGFKKMVAGSISDPKAASRFTSGVISAVNQTPALQDCDPASILSCALLGESLGLSPSPQLGMYYMVPYKDKAKGMVAQFQLGYRGYITMAMRTGEYRRLNVADIREGELISWNPLTEELSVAIEEDDDQREKLPVIGYTASFELLNGFAKTIYWSKAKMISHADKYSKSFSKDATSGRYPKVSFADYEAGEYPAKDEWLYSSPWYSQFDAMAYKTMLRHLLSKWGIMSVDLQRAVVADIGGAAETVQAMTETIPVPIMAQPRPAQIPGAAQEPVQELGPPEMGEPQTVESQAQAQEDKTLGLDDL